MKTENHSVIIDCGEKDDGKKVLECLSEYGISEVDYLFITHFDKDHVGGFPEVAENISADVIAVPDYEGNNKEYEKYLSAIEKNNLTVTTLTEDLSFVLDDVLFEVSVPKEEYDNNDNDHSLVISVTHGDNSFLFAADAESDRLGEVMREFPREYDFLKVPHHGRYNKVTQSFFNAIHPTYAVICDSEKNPAEEETLSALVDIDCTVYSTASGNVRVSSDGKEIRITQ